MLNSHYLYWSGNMGLAFLISAISVGIAIPQIITISFKKKLFDVPDERKIHKGVVPRLGGVLFKPAILFAITVVLGFDLIKDQTGLLQVFCSDPLPMICGLCALMLLYFVGVADDLVGVRYRSKFIVQILCGVLIVSSGLYINNLDGLCAIGSLPFIVGGIVTVFAIVFIVNSINLIDGIDGLASGISMVALLYFGIMFFISGSYDYALISFASLGALASFFIYNVFGKVEKKKKIFMGDTGSLTLGLLLSFLSIKLSTCNMFEGSSNNLFVLAFSPLIIPCFDVVRVYLHRIKNHKSPFLPDKNHIHHKFLAIGMSSRNAMIVIILSSLCFTAGNILLSFVMNINIIFLIDIVIYTMGNILLTKKIEHRIVNYTLN